MKKRLASLCISSMLIIGWINPAIAQSDQATDAGVSSTSQTQIDPDSSLNDNLPVFSDQVTQADQSLGSDRVLFIISCGLGIPLPTVQTDFAAANLSQTDFILAEIIAHESGSAVSDVITQFNQNIPAGRIARQFGVTSETLVLRMRSFSHTFNNEISINNGTIEPGVKDNLRLIRRVRRRATNNFTQFATDNGDEAFNNRLNRQLSLRTGLTEDEIAALRANLPGVSDRQFATALLAASSIAAITPNGSINDIDLNTLLTANDIESALITNNVPVTLFNSRVRWLSNNFAPPPPSETTTTTGSVTTGINSVVIPGDTFITPSTIIGTNGVTGIGINGISGIGITGLTGIPETGLTGIPIIPDPGDTGTTTTPAITGITTTTTGTTSTTTTTTTTGNPFQ